MKKCLFSNRIYKETLSENDVTLIDLNKETFNTMVRRAYNIQYNINFNKKSYSKSVHMTIKSEFNISNDYYVNSAVQEAKALINSQIELKKLYIKNLEIEIKERKKKIKDIEKQLKNKLKVKESIIKITKAIKSGKKIPKFSTYRGAMEFMILNPDTKELEFGVRRKRKDPLMFNIYTFEVCYLDNQIRKLKNRLKQVVFGLNRAEEKLERLKSNPPKKVCFGGRDFFKKLHTTDINHNQWKKEFNYRRNKQMLISGRKDAKQGNFVFRYENKQLSINTIDKKTVKINNVYFPYGQECVDYALNNNDNFRTAVAWEIVDKGNFYIFKCIVELPNDKYINYSKSNGIISIDINVDHIALTNLNKKGSILDTQIFHYDLEGKSSTQSKWILENTIKSVLKVCIDNNKPIAIEDLDTEESKAKLIYGNAKRNKKLSMFAYSSITKMIYSRANKDGVGVFKVNPAYTSQIGKLKYMKILGLSVHTSAALVIGRRSLGFKEKIPKVYKKYISEKIRVKHHWSHWSYLSKELKSVFAKKLYINIDNNYETLKMLKESL